MHTVIHYTVPQIPEPKFKDTRPNDNDPLGGDYLARHFARLNFKEVYTLHRIILVIYHLQEIIITELVL